MESNSNEAKENLNRSKSSTFNLQGTQFSGGMTNADTVNAHQIGSNITNNYYVDKQNFTDTAKKMQDLLIKILEKAQEAEPKFLYQVPEIVGYSKDEVVNKIYEIEKCGFLEALPL